MSGPHHWGPAWLFAPAHMERKARGALESAADVVVLDLEDAVPLAEKAAARAALQGLCGTSGRGRLLVRVNAASTAHCLLDMGAAVAAGADGIMLPKAETAAELHAVAWTLSQLEAQSGREPLALVPLVESAIGLAMLDRIAWDARVERVAFGSVDYALDLRLSGDAGQEAVTDAQFALVRAARAAGLQPPIDGVTLAARDRAQTARDAARARALGFGGKLAIHPAQIEPIQQAFAPTAAELTWAAEVVAAYAGRPAEAGAVLVRDRLVDAPVLAQAERLLATQA